MLECEGEGSADEKVVLKVIAGRWLSLVRAKQTRERLLREFRRRHEVYLKRAGFGAFMKNRRVGEVLDCYSYLRIQQKPSLALFLGAVVAGDEVTASIAHCFTAWLQFLRRRKQWQQFVYEDINTSYYAAAKRKALVALANRQDSEGGAVAFRRESVGLYQKVMRNPVSEMALLITDKERAKAYQSAESGVSGRVQQMKLFFRVWMNEVKDTSSLFQRCAVLYSLKMKANSGGESVAVRTKKVFHKGVEFLASLNLANEESFAALLKSIQENNNRVAVNREVVRYRNRVILETGEMPEFTIKDPVEIDGCVKEYKALIPCDQLGDLLDKQNEPVFVMVVGCTSPMPSFERDSLRKEIDGEEQKHFVTSRAERSRFSQLFAKARCMTPKPGKANDVIKIHNEGDIIEKRLSAKIGASFSDAVMRTVSTDDLDNRVEKFGTIMGLLFGEKTHDDEMLREKLGSASCGRRSSVHGNDPLESRMVVTPIAEKYRKERQSKKKGSDDEGADMSEEVLIHSRRYRSPKGVGEEYAAEQGLEQDGGTADQHGNSVTDESEGEIGRETDTPMETSEAPQEKNTGSEKVGSNVVDEAVERNGETTGQDSEDPDMMIDAINKVVFHILSKNVQPEEDPEEDDCMLVEFDPDEIPGLVIEERQKAPVEPKYHHVWNKPKFYPIWKPKCLFNKRGPLFDPNMKPKRPRVIPSRTEFTQSMRAVVSEISPMSRLTFNNGRATTRHSKTLTTPLYPTASKTLRPRQTSVKIPNLVPEEAKVVSFAGGGRSVGRNTGNFMSVRINNSRRRTTRPISTAKSNPDDLVLAVGVGGPPQNPIDVGFDRLRNVVSSLIEQLAIDLSPKEFETLRRRARSLRRRLGSCGYNHGKIQEITVEVTDLDQRLKDRRYPPQPTAARILELFQQNNDYSPILIDAIDAASRKAHTHVPSDVDLTKIDPSVRVNYVDTAWADDMSCSSASVHYNEGDAGLEAVISPAQDESIDMDAMLQLLPSLISPDEIDAVLSESLNQAKREYQDVMK